MKPPNKDYRKLMTAPAYLRVPVGLTLMAGGVFFFLPVLGLWMLPLGLFVCFAANSDLRRITNRWRRRLKYKIRGEAGKA